MYVEPCCIERVLPELIRDNTHKLKDGSFFSAACFQSGGDWTVSDLLKSVSPLAGGGLMILSLPQADASLMRTLSAYLSKKWCTDILLLTSEGQESLVREFMGTNIDKVTYVVNKGLLDGFLGLYNNGKALCVTGPMLLDKDFSICMYTVMYGSCPDFLYAATDAFRPLLRINPVIKGKGELTEEFLNHKNS